VQAGAEAVGIALDDARGLTVTGGLPYFGGPGNNYSTHAIAATARRLRGQPPGATALVTALGWYTTKHSVGVYGSSPPPLGYRGADTSQEQQKIDATALPISAPPAQPTDAVVDAFTVLYDRDGSAQAAPVIARADGTRLVATADPDELADVSGQVLTGGRVRITGTTYRVLA
jgi:acetyl-CoA C-acetyltransferase